MALPTYTYTPDVPQGPQGMNVTQPILQNNFQAINELINVNHVGFNTPNDFGKHNIVTMPRYDISADFSGTTTDYEMLMFTQAVASPPAPNDTEIFFVYPQGAGQVTPVELPDQNTNAIGVSGSSTCTFNQVTNRYSESIPGYYVQFASGVIFRFGSFTFTHIPEGGNNTITFNAPAALVYPLAGVSTPITTGSPFIEGGLFMTSEGGGNISLGPVSNSNNTGYNYFTMGNY